MKITTLKGKQIDIAALRERHGATVALGNAGMNARGDLVGKGGVVVKSKEELAMEYYENNPKAVTKAAPISLKDIDEDVLTPAQAVERLTKQMPPQPKAAPKPKRETREED